MTRADLAFPFAIAGGSNQAAQASYQDHVDQLIRQVLLTDPGERVNLPSFGAGLRRLLFAPIGASLGSTAQLVITQALTQWIGGQISVRAVSVTTPGPDTGLPDGAVLITIQYVLIETQTPRQTVVTVS